jgi:hypothetical protein
MNQKERIKKRFEPTKLQAFKVVRVDKGGRKRMAVSFDFIRVGV